MPQCTIFYLFFWFTVHLYVLYMQDEEHIWQTAFLTTYSLVEYNWPSIIRTYICTYVQYLLQCAAKLLWQPCTCTLLRPTALTGQQGDCS